MQKPEILKEEDTLLTNTRYAIGKIIDDIKAFSYYFNLAMQVMYFAYLLYAIGTDRGILWLNIALAGLSIIYFVFYVATYNKKADTVRQVKKGARNFHRWCKLAGKTLTLSVMVYSIYATTEDVSPTSVTLTALMVVAWVLQLLFSLVIGFLEKEKELILEAIRKDMEPITKPAKAVSGFFKKFKHSDEDDELREDEVEEEITAE